MMILFLIVLAIVLQVSNAMPADVVLPNSWSQFDSLHGKSMESLFNQFKGRFQKNYKSDIDEKTHFAVFASRVKSILDWNENGGHSYKKGINVFTDLDADERRQFVMPETKMEVEFLLLNLFLFKFI